ncbi:energy transducer TonB [Acidicapsa acidisoli]|uniref:energy transducer TonB n=1 Tax=Acidicapsa acidisoli TaxID=1615681 RepID=UPI0021DFE1A6|nr:energy transducer TonB [Acidicapsa acidisoli]
MLKLLSVTILMALALVPADAQEPNPSIAAPATDAVAERVKVYYGGPEVILPELLPPPESLKHDDECVRELKGYVKLSLLVDSEGRPRNVTFNRPQGNELDQLALLAAEADRFKPGTLNGVPVASAIIIEMRLHGCVVSTKDSPGNNRLALKFRNLPDQKIDTAPEAEDEVTLTPDGIQKVERVGGKVLPPKAILKPDAGYSDYARRKKIEGDCIVVLTIDVHGLPQNVHVTRGLEPGLDDKAISAVRHYRFQPATLDGMPVPVVVSAEVRFRLY